MSEQVLKIAIVGHTNTGKTSLIRTLARERSFGVVEDRGGTTRQVEVIRLPAGAGRVIELYDSPGLENAPELLEWLDAAAARRHDGPDRIRRLLDDGQARQRFDHESRVLGLMLEVDVALYVVDTREPVLEKYKDELTALNLCARPIVAVLNFVAQPSSREAEWREALARLTLHTVLAFDAVLRDPATEFRLFEKLRSLLDPFSTLLDSWIEQRARQEQERLQAGLVAIAGLLVDLAGWRELVPAGDAVTRQAAMQARVRAREQACVETLLDLYRFGREDCDDAGLPLNEGRWAADPFDANTLHEHGIRSAGYLGLGAGAGAAFDLMTGGLSLGAGTLAGTAGGAGAGLLQTFGRSLRARVRGEVDLVIDEPTIRLVASRQLELLDALVRRGHASQTPVRLADRSRWQQARLPRPLRQARVNPGWSSLARETSASPGREAAIESLAGILSDHSP
ncbi:MAG: GTPase/DUF3482 domain-containing protein [Chromatiales bacterium]|nr:GTPase/DUF3482 domain-containing protein [Chromatiales bacterium]